MLISKRQFIFIFVFAVMQLSVCPANPADSLRKIISNSKNDSLIIIAYNGLFYQQINKPSEALQIISEMQRFSEGVKNKADKALCIRKIGTFYHRLNYFDKALEYYFESAAIFTSLKDKAGIANCYNNMANAYASKGELTLNQEYYDRAIDYHLKCISLRKEIDTSQLSNSYNNIGISYMNKGKYELALEYFNKAYKIYAAKPDGKGGIEMVTMNLGEVYLQMAMKENKKEYYDKSLYYFKTRLDEYKTGGPNDRHATVLSKIGQILCETGQCREAVKFLKRAYSMSCLIKNKSAIMESSFLLSKAMEKQGDCVAALEYLRLYNQTKDELINDRNASAIEQMTALFESAEKDKAIETLSRNNEIQVMKVNKQRIGLFSMFGGIIILTLFGLLFFNRYNIKRRANIELARAYQKIEVKNKQITDSINYARRIQSAILPPVDAIRQYFKHPFVYYSPKDIVSGDFYWFAHQEGKSFFAVADCTGHGVPGALMSMIGNTMLNEIVNQKYVLDPAEILYHLNDGVIKALRQSGLDIKEQDDGMDICICCIEDKNRNKLKYASANLSFYCKTKSGVKELRGDIFSIGGGSGTAGKMFQTKTEELEEGTVIIMSTDGYYDQFGGKNNSKFLVANFEDLIAGTDFSSNNTAEVLKKQMEIWKGNNNQTDDILVAGFVV